VRRKLQTTSGHAFARLLPQANSPRLANSCRRCPCSDGTIWSGLVPSPVSLRQHQIDEMGYNREWAQTGGCNRAIARIAPIHGQTAQYAALLRPTVLVQIRVDHVAGHPCRSRPLRPAPEIPPARQPSGKWGNSAWAPDLAPGVETRPLVRGCDSCD
jgi:hypothetical protein